MAFDRLARRLESALGELAIAVEHVGSTAVPGLAAKPILDVAVGLAPGTCTENVMVALEPLGLIHRGDKGDSGGVLFVMEDKPEHRLAHIHVVGYGDGQWRRYLRVRDRLRADPDARAAYAALKQDLAERFPDDRASYTAGKDSFLATLAGGRP